MTFLKHLIVISIFLCEICLASEKIIVTGELAQSDTREDFAYNLRSRAENGDVNAKYLFGMANVERMWGFNSNIDDGVKLLVEAAESGHIEAMEYLVWLYSGSSSFLTAKNELAIKWAQIAASKESIYAILKLGIMYEYGIGFEKNYDNAKYYYLEANELGDPHAGRLLKNLDRKINENLNSFENNERETQTGNEDIYSLAGIAPRAVSREEIYEELKSLADDGNVRAMYLQGSLLFGDGDRFEATKLITKAAELGDADAAVNLSRMYSGANQRSILDKDLDKSSYWMSIAADRGSPEALFQRGLKHSYYLDSNESSPLAFKYVLQSAEAGHYYAQEKVGEYYFRGKHVNQDYERAAYWYLKAFKRKPYYRYSQLDVIFQSAKFYQSPVEKVLQHLNEARELRIPSATAKLGERAERGTDGPRDLHRALALYREANDVLSAHRVFNIIESEKSAIEKIDLVEIEEQIVSEIDTAKSKFRFRMFGLIIILLLVAIYREVRTRQKR